MLFDGVFAIAMTILVLELKVPELGRAEVSAGDGGGASASGPTFLSYLLSFGILGMFWFRHNAQYRHFHTITGGGAGGALRPARGRGVVSVLRGALGTLSHQPALDGHIT